MKALFCWTGSGWKAGKHGHPPRGAAGSSDIDPGYPAEEIKSLETRLSQVPQPAQDQHRSLHRFLVFAGFLIMVGFLTLIARIGEMICYQSYNVKGPLNAEAAAWGEQNPEVLPPDQSRYHRRPVNPRIMTSRIPGPRIDVMRPGPRLCLLYPLCYCIKV